MRQFMIRNRTTADCGPHPGASFICSAVGGCCAGWKESPAITRHLAGDSRDRCTDRAAPLSNHAPRLRFFRAALIFPVHFFCTGVGRQEQIGETQSTNIGGRHIRCYTAVRGNQCWYSGTATLLAAFLRCVTGVLRCGILPMKIKRSGVMAALAGSFWVIHVHQCAFFLTSWIAGCRTSIGSIQDFCKASSVTRASFWTE